MKIDDQISHQHQFLIKVSFPYQSHNSKAPEFCKNAFLPPTIKLTTTEQTTTKPTTTGPWTKNYEEGIVNQRKFEQLPASRNSWTPIMGFPSTFVIERRLFSSVQGKDSIKIIQNMTWPVCESPVKLYHELSHPAIKPQVPRPAKISTFSKAEDKANEKWLVNRFFLCYQCWWRMLKTPS